MKKSPTVPKARSKKEVPSSTAARRIKFQIKKVSISDLVPHEGTIEQHIKRITKWMKKDGYQLRPIAISKLDSLGSKWKGKYLIHDGHHRTAAMKRLGRSHIIGSVFDYSNPKIKVFRYYRTNVPVPKQVVLERATSGKEVTPRFDKHFIIGRNGELLPFHDNPMLEPKIRVKLSELR